MHGQVPFSQNWYHGKRTKSREGAEEKEVRKREGQENLQDLHELFLILCIL
jgi:hypothetical protein